VSSTTGHRDSATIPATRTSDTSDSQRCIKARDRIGRHVVILEQYAVNCYASSVGTLSDDIDLDSVRPEILRLTSRAGHRSVSLQRASYDSSKSEALPCRTAARNNTALALLDCNNRRSAVVFDYKIFGATCGIDDKQIHARNIFLSRKRYVPT
jgi:hypothetical protein